MAEPLLDKCLRCGYQDYLEIIKTSTNGAGGEVYQIECNNCGLKSVEESSQDRLVRWWNFRPPQELRDEKREKENKR